MPTVPRLPADMLRNSGSGLPTDPANFLLAAADLHSSGELSAPVPTGKTLQTGKRPSRASLSVIK